MSKFFKIPIDKLLRKFPKKEGNFIEFNESQKAMIQGLEEKRFWVHIAARRTGKSYAASIIALAKLLEPNTQVMVVAPNYKLSSIIWDYVTTFIKELGIETERWNQKDNVVKLINGSVFRLLSANNRDSLVGRAAHLIIVDEAAIIDNDEYFTRDLRPAMSTFADSRILFISTPRGKRNYLFEYFNRKDDNEFQDTDGISDWGSGLYTWEVNPFLNPKDIEAARKAMTKSLFEQEYYCSWETFEGQIYALSEEKNLVKESKNKEIKGNRRYEVIAGLDVGYRDETAFITIATDGVIFIIIDEYIAKEGTTSTHAAIMQEKIDEWNIEQIYIDSAAQQTKADLAYDYNIYCEDSVKDVNAGIQAIQVLIEKGDLLIDRNNCPATWTALSTYRWNPNTETEKPLHDEASHASDAVRYAIYTYVRNQVDIYSAT